MKKILISILTLIFIISISISANAATTGTVTITLSNETIKAGDEFSIIVTATDTNNLNTVEYSGLTITDESGNITTAITVKSTEAVGDNWAKMNADGKTNFVYSGEAIQSEKVFKVTFSVGDNIVAGTYKINIDGIKVSSTNLEDITTDIGTKTVSVKAIVDDTTVGNDNQNGEGNPEEGNPDNSGAPEDEGNPGNDEVPSNNNGNSNNKSNGSTGNKNNKPTKLPQTGVESFSILAIITLGIVSIASYVSYRKYKNI